MCESDKSSRFRKIQDAIRKRLNLKNAGDVAYIGGGGSGIVFAYEHDGRYWCVKVLKEDLSNEVDKVQP